VHVEPAKRRLYHSRHHTQVTPPLTFAFLAFGPVIVLQHLTGYLKNHLSGEDKQELLGLIEDYLQGQLPLIRATHTPQASPEPASGAGMG